MRHNPAAWAGLVRCLSVRWGIFVQRGMSVRRRLGKKGGAGLISAIAPVAVGVLLAYAWNAAGAPGPHGSLQVRIPVPYVGTAAEQAAAQAWARITPAASAARSFGTPGTSAGTSGTSAGTSGTPAGPQGGRQSPSPASAGSRAGVTGCVRIPIVHQHSKATPGVTAAPPSAPPVSAILRSAGTTASEMAAADPIAANRAAEAEPAGTGKAGKGWPHGLRLHAGTVQCQRGWEPATRVSGKSHTVSGPGKSLPAASAWPAQHSANPPLGSSAAERVGSARDMRVVQTAVQTQARSRRWPPLKRSMPGRSWIPGETQLLR